jgi:uncharacterized protein (DUF1501 family)
MKNCPSCRKLTRREALAGMGTWAALAALQREGRAQVVSGNVAMRKTAKVCVFINLVGAASHLDTFDVKDASWNPADADIQQSGKLALSTTLFPKVSRLTGDLCVLRSVSSWEAEHTRGQFYVQTAHPANPAFISETPHMGAVAALELGGQGKMPPFLALNGSSGQGATFLGGRYEPMAAPANQGGFSTLQHCCLGNTAQAQARFLQRFQFLEELDQAGDPATNLKMAAQSSYSKGARDLMYDPLITQVFQFTAEEAQRYGNTNFGRSCIVARNAVRARAGVSFINIQNGGWDTHQSMFDTRYPGNFYNLANQLDAGVGELVADLKASGHLGETLIVIMTEFGRTPGPLNGRGGRDHHRWAMSAAMIGGGVKGGTIIGETDANGEKIIDPGWHAQRPIYVEDITTTIYSALGINWTKRILETPTGRIFEYVAGSLRGDFEPVDEVFG